MKSRDTLVRLKRFQVEEKRRRVRQIEMMLAEFTRMTADLDREIANEEKRAGIADPTHFAYPTYARAASVRRDNLKSSIAELMGQIEEAKAAQQEAEGELLKFEALEVRDKANDRLIEAAARA
jgi:flagellar protein FliJ